MAWSLQIHSAHQCQSDFLVQPYEGWTGPSLRETKKINDPSRKSRKWVNQFQTHLAAMDSKGPIVSSCDFVAVWFSKNLNLSSAFGLLPSNHMSQAQAVVPAKAQHWEMCASCVRGNLFFSVVELSFYLWTVTIESDIIEGNLEPSQLFDAAWRHWHALMSLMGAELHKLKLDQLEGFLWAEIRQWSRLMTCSFLTLQQNIHLSIHT